MEGIHKGYHCAYQIHYHLVFPVKYRKALMSEPIVATLKHITDEVINQDLNTLLPYDTFSRIRKVLKQETLMFLRDEQRRIEQGG